MDKPKFSKRKCLECKYHSVGIGDGVNVDNKYIRIHCNYSATGETCLKKTENGIIDQRGEDYLHCKLFKKGKAIDEEDILRDCEEIE